jgi:antirestriction protein
MRKRRKTLFWGKEEKMCEVRIYLTNLAQYNAGRLIGQWFDLPLTEEELAIALKEVLGSDEEYFITDYSADFRIEEFENLSELNVFVKSLSELDEHDQEKVIYLINCIGYKKQDAIERLDDVIYYQGMTLEEVAEEMVEDGMLGNLSDDVKGYLDFEKIARDLSFNGYHETTQGTFWCS